MAMDLTLTPLTGMQCAWINQQYFASEACLHWRLHGLHPHTSQPLQQVKGLQGHLQCTGMQRMTHVFAWGKQPLVPPNLCAGGIGAKTPCISKRKAL